MKKILVVEDDTILSEGLTHLLSSEYNVKTCSTIKETEQVISNEYFDLAIVDCNLPDGSGFKLCEKFKAERSERVLVLTARNTELDEIHAFKIGADDFVSKPFSTGVLLERVKNLMKSDKEAVLLKSKGVIIDLSNGTVKKENVVIELTSTEYRLLCYLVTNKNHVLTKEMIMNHVWNDIGTFVDSGSLFAMISRLRQKIETDPRNPKQIVTIHGLGYIWKE